MMQQVQQRIWKLVQFPNKGSAYLHGWGWSHCSFPQRVADQLGLLIGWVSIGLNARVEVSTPKSVLTLQLH